MRLLKLIFILILSLIGFPFWLMGILYGEFRLSFKVGKMTIEKLYDEVLG